MSNQKTLKYIDLLHARSISLLRDSDKTREECKKEFDEFDKADPLARKIRSKASFYLGVFFAILESVEVDLEKNKKTNPIGMLVSMAEFLALAEEAIDSSRRMRSYASIRVKNDPRQEQKAFVYECWCIWQNDLSRYKNKTNFATDMLNKLGGDDSQATLNSIKVITDWCRKWDKDKV